jgi:hypothetical protein
MTPLMKVEESSRKPSWTPLAVWQTWGLICLIVCAKLCKTSIADVDVSVKTEIMLIVNPVQLSGLAL